MNGQMRRRAAAPSGHRITDSDEHRVTLACIGEWGFVWAESRQMVFGPPTQALTNFEEHEPLPSVRRFPPALGYLFAFPLYPEA
jgi:hypothetical protein